MTPNEKEVIRNIIYAVETGGQVYGQCRYNDFTEAYTNSSEEHAITIGAGQWYATEARSLLCRIRNVDTKLFESLDTAGIGNDLDNSNWSTYKLSKSSAKAKCIVKIIDTDIGHKCQDSMIIEQMEQYIAFAAKQGVTDIDAQMMCANFQHQGGSGAVTRILAKTPKPYTLDNLYAACQSDTGNQVGAYKSRQKMVYNALKTHLKSSNGNTTTTYTKQDAINAVIKAAEGEIGYLEKASNSQLDSKTGNAGYNNYTKYWRDVYPSYQAQAWCAAFVTWCFDQVFGKDVTKTLLKHYPYVYCPTLGNLFTKYANPQVGDIVIFYRGGTFAHTGLVTKVSGDYFETIEGNTSAGSDIVPNGGGVYRKSYYNSNLPGTKFCRVDWDYAAKQMKSSSTPSESFKRTNSGTVTASALNLRSTPSNANDSNIIGVIYNGNRFDTDGQSSGDWVHINVSTVGVGWVHKDYIVLDKTVEPEIITTTTTETKTVDYAVKQGDTLSSIAKANDMTVAAVVALNKWLQVGKSIKIKKKFTTTTKYTVWVGKVTASELNVRQKPGVENALIAEWPKLSNGNLVDIIGEATASDGNKWYHVRIAKQYKGYVSAQYITKI